MSQFVQKAELLRTSAAEKATTLATGTLALSVTFRTSLVPDDPQFLWCLSAAWIALTISIVAHIMGMLCEASVWLDFAQESKPANDLSRKHKWLIAVPAFLTWGGFGVGISFFTTFALWNIKT